MIQSNTKDKSQKKHEKQYFYCYFMLLLRCTKMSTIRHVFLNFFSISPIKCRVTDSKYICRLPCRYFSIFTLLTYLFKLIRHFLFWSAKSLSVTFCCCNSFCLPLVNKFPLCLCHICKYLQYQICDQCSC